MSLEEFRKKVKDKIALGQTQEAIIILIDNLKGFDEPILFSSTYYSVRRDYSINIIPEDVFYRNCNKINDGILNFLKIVEYKNIITKTENETYDKENKPNSIPQNDVENKKKTVIFAEKSFTWRDVFSFWNKRKVNNYKKYTESLASLIDIYSDINELHRFENPTSEKIMKSGTEICTKLKHIYDDITNSNTSVSIKIIVSKGGSLDSDVITLCRDNARMMQRKAHYETRKHKVTDNTSFAKILQSFLYNKTENVFYFSNNLTSENNYSNTSEQYYGTTKSNHWTLPYKSEIVVPITPLKKEQDKDVIMIGFLCMDCDNTNTFNETLDIKILQSIADSLFDPLTDWFKINN